jgi:hypothetical protein
MVFDLLIENTARLFRDPAKFIQAFAHDLPTNEYATIQETLSGTFATPEDELAPAVVQQYYLTAAEMQRASPQAPASMRAGHAALTLRALADEKRWLLYLTGYPGIGKTTTIAEYLMEQFAEYQQGFILLYASPRKTVNRGIFGKFRSLNGAPFFSPYFSGLTTSMSLIRDAQAGNKPVVEYLGDSANLPTGPHNSVYLTPEKVERLRFAPWREADTNRYQAQEEGRQEDVGISTAGVLRSIAAATGELFSRERANAIVSAFSIHRNRARPGCTGSSGFLSWSTTNTKDIANS